MITALLEEAAERRARGDILGALAACERAVSLAPDDARGYSRLGHLALERFEYDRARHAFGMAAKLSPDDIGYLNNYGMLLTYAGDFAGAREQFQRALRLDRNCIPAYYNLATIALSEDAADLAHSLEKLRSAVRTPLDRSLLGFALGKLYDDLGEWDRAFANYDDANRARAAKYDHAWTVTFFEGLKRACASLAAAAADVVDGQFQPIFIVGMPRSGSSLVEELLARRPDVAGLGERSEWPSLMAALGQRHPSRLGFPACVPALGVRDYQELARAYRESVAPQVKSAARAIDKQLANFQFVPLLKATFPRASIVHCVRNPVDTCLSTYFTNFQMGHSYSFNLLDVAAYYGAYRDLTGEWERRSPNGLHVIRYEAVVENKEQAVLDLQSRLGLPGDRPPDAPAARDIRTSSAWQARQPVYTRAVQRWRNYEKHLGPLIDALGPLAA